MLTEPKHRWVSLALAGVLFAALVWLWPRPVQPPEPARSESFVLGTNFVNPQRLPLQEQNAMLDAMQREGVKVIRTPYALEKPDLTILERARQRGIKVLLIVEVIFPKDAPFFAWDKQNYPGIWSGHPLSSASPALAGEHYRKLMADLDAAGIELAGLQLGNEINSPAFNREFPVPGEGRQFGLRDLEEHPVGRRIAQGYRRYIEVLAELKRARNGSKLNRSTPVIAAGLVGYEGPEGPLRNARTDMVSANATLDYLRAHGADDVVDAYAVHVYPWHDNPGQASGETGRRNRLSQFVLARCGTEGRKPCWVTEWGFRDTQQICPPQEANRLTLTQEMRRTFAHYAQSGRLKGLLVYAWNDPSEGFATYRCGGLTDSGRAAIRP